MTPKQRERVIKRAAKALDQAWEAMGDLHDLMSECGIDVKHHELDIRRYMRERSEQLEASTWWKKIDD